MSQEAQLATDLLVYATIAIDITIVSLLAGYVFCRTPLLSLLAQWRIRTSVVATLVALGALGGSMTYGAVTGFQACALCLTSRTIMALIFVTLSFALFQKSKEHVVVRIGMTLALAGFFVSLYQYILQWLALTGTHLPCPAVSGLPSCDRIYFVEFGFITIPFVALSSFVLIFTLLFISRKMRTGEEHIIQRPV